MVKLIGKARHVLGYGSGFVASPTIKTGRTINFPKGVVESSLGRQVVGSGGGTLAAWQRRRRRLLVGQVVGQRGGWLWRSGG